VLRNIYSGNLGVESVASVDLYRMRAFHSHLCSPENLIARSCMAALSHEAGLPLADFGFSEICDLLLALLGSTSQGESVFCDCQWMVAEVPTNDKMNISHQI